MVCIAYNYVKAVLNCVYLKKKNFLQALHRYENLDIKT